MAGPSRSPAALLLILVITRKSWAVFASTLFGTREASFMDCIRQQLPNLGWFHVRSLCCGDGEFECALVEQDVFGTVMDMDTSLPRVLLRAMRASQPVLRP